MRSTWKLRGELRDLSRQGMVMGILNVTPDSFSDGGNYVELDQALAQGLRLIEQGAQIIDVGGESTRPGSGGVSVEDEISRVVPIIRELRQRSDVYISVDTMKGDVAAAAIEVGADIINDVNGFRESRMLEVAASCDAALVVMHMQGVPRYMQEFPRYDHVVTEVRQFFEERLRCFTSLGIAEERIVFDPGVGFGKTLNHNLELLRALPSLRVGERPLLVGVSRKSMIGAILGSSILADRSAPTVALTAWMRDAGAEIIRVHEVLANVQAMKMAEAIRFGV